MGASRIGRQGTVFAWHRDMGQPPQDFGNFPWPLKVPWTRCAESRAGRRLSARSCWPPAAPDVVNNRAVRKKSGWVERRDAPNNSTKIGTILYRYWDPNT